MPSDLALKAMNAAHRVLLKASFGKVGWQAGAMPVLELTTTGRKSGQPRSVMLTSPLQEGDTVVVVASRGGDDIHPAWFLNLRDHPAASIRTGRRTLAVTAETATADERPRLWALATEMYPGYDAYQAKTTREIPVVILTPTA